ncbi:TetR/AcrR family transcriptional regulator [Amycolatopsis sp. NBC_00348]|uniref:TetR family transcriptional regulator n=1 Tax=unclassified Amycolatopsis TaxID=2618356 RepID=UPI002E106534|nr:MULTISPECIES: TetR family transcriptional regulator [unclassified Amycolatopsis]WSJ79234.1 TetR/AcrR family transcriptional regulator [Amycolatopsis sp. NBC_01307]
MSPRTVNWAASRTRRNGEPEVEGLRERKKRLMRQQLSDTATEMFVERGFDAVRVAEIAEACGVSEKTVFNYFPTKESLILDHPDAALTALRSDLAEPGVSPVEATLRILAEERAAVLSWLAEQDDPAEAVTKSRRFGLLIATTPALRAHRLEMTEQLVVVAAEALAERAGTTPDDPEPRVLATALVALWQIQFRSMAKHLDVTRTAEEVEDLVSADVGRAAGLVEAGLAALPEFAGEA